jgi:signal peptidase I
MDNDNLNKNKDEEDILSIPLVDEEEEVYTFIDDNKGDKDLPEEKSEGKKSVIISEIYEWIEAIALSVVLVVILFTFVFRIVVVDGSSMINTLHNTDRIIISNFFYKPAAQDVVVFIPNLKNFENKPFVKRIIATEGQVVDVNAQKHTVSVNGVILNEPYIYEPLATAGNQTFPLTVPKGQVFVMGDNRNNSYDSRFAEVGTVDIRNILGRAVFRIFPFNKLGNVD